MFSSPIQLLIVAVLALVLFGGKGKIPSIMRDLAKGITSFKKGLKEDPDTDASDDAIDVTPPRDKKK